jgi:hypothetical protein
VGETKICREFRKRSSHSREKLNRSLCERDAWVGLWRLVWVTGAQTKEALVEAIGKAIDVVDNRDARSFFTRWSYSELKQDFG